MNAAIGIRDSGLNDGLVDPQVQTEDNVRLIAERLLALRNRLEMREYEPPVPSEPMMPAPAPAKREIGSDDWEKLAARFDKLPQGIRAQNTTWSHPKSEWWHISGFPGHAECDALCELAGNMLLKSPGVLASLPVRVRMEADSVSRWLYLLKSIKGGLDNYLSASETHDDGTTNLIGTGCINELAQTSSMACIRCSAKEI